MRFVMIALGIMAPVLAGLGFLTGQGTTVTRSASGATASAVPPTLTHLFTATARFTSSAETEPVVSPEGREGAYLGNGDGTVVGERLRGAMRWAGFSGSCLYPRIREGQTVPDDLHLCTLNPGGFIDTHDGARIAFDGKGYGQRSPERYRLSMTLAFSSEDSRYTWLTRELAVMAGELNERTGESMWHVYLPRN